jgi:hypothetical protein
MLSLYFNNETQNSTIHYYDEETRQEWLRFFNIAQTLQKVNNSIIFNLNLALLMGENLQDFWRYQGSLTTPPCTENVIWTIFKDPIIFVESEFQSFREDLYFEDYRRPQPLYTRIIYRNFIDESLSLVPDYNCCPRKDLNQLSDGLRSSYYSAFFIFLAIFSCFFIVF